MCPQMLMHATPHRVSYLGFYTVNHCGYIRVNAHRGCMNTVRESTLQVDSGKKNPLLQWGIKPVSVMHVAFQSTALAAVIPPLATHPFRVKLFTMNITIIIFIGRFRRGC